MDNTPTKRILDDLANLAARCVICSTAAIRAGNDPEANARYEDAFRALQRAAEARVRDLGTFESNGAVIERATARAWRLGYLRQEWL